MSGSPTKAEVGRQVEFDPPHLAVADILRLVDEGAGTLRPFHAGVGEFDQVVHLAVEDVDPDDAGAADALFIAQIDAPRGFGVEQRIAEQIVVAELGFEQRGRDEVEFGTAAGARDRCGDAAARADVDLDRRRWQQLFIIIVDARRRRRSGRQW